MSYVLKKQMNSTTDHNDIFQFSLSIHIQHVSLNIKFWFYIIR